MTFYISLCCLVVSKQRKKKERKKALWEQDAATLFLTSVLGCAESLSGAACFCSPYKEPRETCSDLDAETSLTQNPTLHMGMLYPKFPTLHVLSQAPVHRLALPPSLHGDFIYVSS